MIDAELRRKMKAVAVARDGNIYPAGLGRCIDDGFREHAEIGTRVLYYNTDRDRSTHVVVERNGEISTG